MPLHEPLSTWIKHPLEREYEAWTIRGIEDYFSKLGRRIDVFALGPREERTWPADQCFKYNGKIIGLQFKRARLAPGPLDYSRLYWSFSNPPYQLGLVSNFDEIYYCLPTFINRLWRRDALDHCLFWRPGSKSNPSTCWYDNPNASSNRERKHLNRDPAAFRWGALIERIEACIVGKPVSSSQSIERYFSAFQGALIELNSAQSAEIGERDPTIFYFIHIEMEVQ
jgi:hypothetical protein